MRPDELPRTTGPARSDGFETVVPFETAAELEPALAELAAELERAGSRAASGRVTDDRERPSPAFVAGLRDRLLEQLPSAPRGMVPSSSASLVGPRHASLRVGHVVGSRELTPGGAPFGAAQVARPTGTRVTMALPSVLPAPRWTALAVAAALILTVVGFNGSLPVPGPAPARAAEAVGATLARDGTVTALLGGTVLRDGDEIAVEASGRATLEIADGVVRLGGGSALRIDRLDGGTIALEQLAGRVWHRVATAPGTTYTVRTSGLEWRALGTAFDLTRRQAAGSDRIEVLAVEHDVRLVGEIVSTTVAEGRRAVVTLQAGPPDLEIQAADRRSLNEPWLLANAQLDAELGFGLGILSTLDASETPKSAPLPTGSPSIAPPIATDEPRPTEDVPPPTAEPTPRPTPGPTPPPAAEPTPRPTPRPTAKPTPKPTVPPLAGLSLSTTGCGGGLVLLDWSTYAGDAFARYVVLRSAGDAIAAAWPPQGGAVVVNESQTADVTHSSALDLWAGPGTWSYRALALDAANRVLGATDVKAAIVKPTAALGPLTVGPLEGGTSFGWSSYAGPSWCFSYEKLVYSAEDSTPSYLEGAAAAWVGENPAATSAWVEGLPPGTYWFRLQAIRVTEFGKVIVAQTDVVSYTVP